jgi:hypothetical protein
MGIFKTLKEKRKKKKADKKRRRETIRNLEIRMADCAEKLNSPIIDKETRTYVREELKECSQTVERHKKLERDEKANLWWFIKTIVGFLLSLLLMILTLAIPPLSNKYSDKATRLFETLTKQRFG